MDLRFIRLTGVLVFVAAAIVPLAALAQPTSITQLNASETVADKITRAYFTNDPDFFHNRSFGRQLDFILGLGSPPGDAFPENEITQDGKMIDVVYQDALKQQVSNDPVVRTRDLPNPYQTSILTSPRLNANRSQLGREFIFETLPPQ